MSSQVNLKHCTAYMIYTYCPSISYCMMVFFRRLLLSSAYGSTCDWTGFLICQEWERVEVSTDVRHQWLCVNHVWWFDLNIIVFCSPEETVPSSSISMLSLCCGCCKPNRENSENDPERCEWDTHKNTCLESVDKEPDMCLQFDEVHLDILDFLYVLHIIRMCVWLSVVF